MKREERTWWQQGWDVWLVLCDDYVHDEAEYSVNDIFWLLFEGRRGYFEGTNEGYAEMNLMLEQVWAEREGLA